jgi:Ca2+-transporting ATPase
VTHVDDVSTTSRKGAKSPDSEASGKKSKSKKKKKGEAGEDDGKTTHQLELDQDAAIDPTPFAFKPYELAHMLDPKNLDTLASFGGVQGLLRGLGANAERGLSSSGVGNEDSHDTEPTEKEKAGQSDSHTSNSNTQYAEKDAPPEIMLTAPSGDTTAATPPEDPKAANATIADRKRVYGENILPTRRSKSLLQLMWMALKDKVLVRTLFLTVRFGRSSFPRFCFASQR